MTPLVTVGIPTYDRPDLLKRALSSIARQSYGNLEVLVADNASPGSATSRVIDLYRAEIRGLRYYRHERNIGALANFKFLLAEARGRYFMWLADDDEISDNYIASLVDVLESDPGSASAAGHWLLMESELTGRPMPTSNYPQSSAFARAVRFVWRSDDAFFYGLHRTELLRTATFSGYAWPNRGVMQNWAYVYLLDMVLKGRITIAPDTSVMFINHDYTAKSYARRRHTFWGVVGSGLRRVNVHYLYWRKCCRSLGPIVMPIIVLASLMSLIREGVSKLIHRAAHLPRGRTLT